MRLTASTRNKTAELLQKDKPAFTILTRFLHKQTVPEYQKPASRTGKERLKRQKYDSIFYQNRTLEIHYHN